MWHLQYYLLMISSVVMSVCKQLVTSVLCRSPLIICFFPMMLAVFKWYTLFSLPGLISAHIHLFPVGFLIWQLCCKWIISICGLTAQSQSTEEPYCVKLQPNTAYWTKRKCWILMLCQLFAAFNEILTVTHTSSLECIAPVCAFPSYFILKWRGRQHVYE